MFPDAILLPLKRFVQAKSRLRLGGTTGVTELAEELALSVLMNCAPRHVVVLGESDEISAFAAVHEVEVWHSSAGSLNEAVQGAYVALGERFERVMVVHGDLRKPYGLGQFRPGSGLTIVTDHHGTGTNVLVVSTGLDFHFAYGRNSADLHQREAERLGISCDVITDSPWCFDVDVPNDLEKILGES
jgi:2-phospho-L-lactate guanylyltransferase (CobY/MobA/RfbA family)